MHEAHSPLKWVKMGYGGLRGKFLFCGWKKKKVMKKTLNMNKRFFTALICVLLTVLAISTNAQTVTLAFTGKKNGSNQYVRLTKVEITNLTRNWTETIYYPDTILQLSCGVGIEDFETEEGFALSQNIPNPFAGQTDFVLRMVEADNVHIAVYDINGKKITGLDQQLSIGIHSFRIMLSTPQAYILKVHTKKNSGTVKILNTGDAGENRIEYLGETNYPITYQLETGKGNSSKPFMLGDLMQYVGFSNYYGTECHSQTVTQAQTSSELFTLKFSCDNQPPVVNISPVISITHNSAVCGGEVISEGTGNVIDRGVCWNTDIAPTTYPFCTHDGTGSGSFTSQITGLSPGTLYYVRAYARNNVSIAYSSDGYNPAPAFYTLPYVVTDDIPDILPTSTATSVTLHGQVQYSTSVSMISKGFCWSTSPNPTTNDNQVSASGAGSNISATVTGLTRGVTYYVRAYAQINGNPLVYGNEVSFVAVDYPEVTTNNISSITATSATCGGNVNSDGGVSVTARGVYCSTSSNFGGSYFVTTNGSGTGSFTSSLTNLIPNTTYYVKAYATSSAGTRFGEVKSFTTAPPSVPTVTTNSVTNVTATSATCGGNVTDDGASSVNDRGVCWSTTQNPTVWDNHISNGNGTGTYSSSITGLAPVTTYYVRAYATNSVGTGYGEQKSFTTSASIPTVTTNIVSNITDSTATCGGNVTFDGGATVTARGVCWGVVSNPTLNDSHTVDGSGMGSFISSITGLTPGVTYYVRAYATNIIGTAYGENVSIANPLDGQPCPNAATVTDYDGNIYNTVILGNQCWMKENLRTTHYSDGSLIEYASGTSSAAVYSTTVAYLYYPNGNDNSAYMNPFGLLYNWSAAMHGETYSDANPSGVQGICPIGWHLPSDAEWTQLAEYVGNQSEYVCDNNSTYVAKALASNIGWETSNDDCAVGKNQSGNNASAFSVLPAGGYWAGDPYNFHKTAFFWSSTYSNQIRYMSNFSKNFVNSEFSSDGCASVRCLRDEYSSTTQLPTVTTTAVSEVFATFASSGGNVTAESGNPVFARGICWSTSPTPTISDNHTVDGGGSGNFVSNLTDLTPNTVYFVRAYATNDIGTEYGNEISFSTQAPFNCGVNIASDYDGNTYNTLLLGNQCWMRENLHTTHYADGTDIAMGNALSSSMAYRYYPDNNSSYVTTYGYLYNKLAVMHGAPPSSLNPSGVKGICPDGWHVPSAAEWTQLSDYMGAQNAFTCGTSSQSNLKIAKALASTIGWNNSTVNCAVGNEPNTNNATGFSALPAGSYSGAYNDFGNQVRYFTTTPYSSSGNMTRILSYNSSTLSGGDAGHWGHSVRCVFNGKPMLPVTTSIASDITDTSTISGGSVFIVDDSAVTARGVCWSIFPNPTIADDHTLDGSGNGKFTSILIGLTAGTTYYIRAFVTNNDGTIYGNEVSFTTNTPASAQDGQSCLNNPVVTDYDGNIYNTVQIGRQCWMKENLRTTHYANGTIIPETDRDYPDDYSFNANAYGYLYNILVTTYNSSSTDTFNVQGVCPVGWHLPKYDEWNQLIDYIKKQTRYQCDNYSNNIAKAMAANMGWNIDLEQTCSPGFDQLSNNTTGFSALPAGGRIHTDYYLKFGKAAAFWGKNTNQSQNYQYVCKIEYDNVDVQINPCTTSELSIRCIRDEMPSIITSDVSLISSTFATCGGNVTFDGGEIVTARGVCWSTSPNPNTSDNYTSDGNGTGGFSSLLSGLTPNTTYYVRAYATNGVGTAYGEQQSFTTLASVACPNAPSVTDYDGNTYNTVQIGNQCWMKENLKTTHYSDGTEIPLSTTIYPYGDTITPLRYYPNNLSSNLTAYGYWYNWEAVMKNAPSSNNNPSGRQGVCPVGWHVPSKAEWEELINYVSSQFLYLCDSNNNYIAKSLSDTIRWLVNNNVCAVGNTLNDNNSTGFSALPSGFGGSNGIATGKATTFATSTRYINTYYNPPIVDHPYYFYISYDRAYVEINHYRYAYSVRCLRSESDGNTTPSVMSDTVSNITDTTAMCGGDVITDGNAPVITRGVCWNTLQNPKVSDSHTSDGTGTGSFTSILSGLTPGTTYYVRAYATNNKGVAYGEQRSFTTSTESVSLPIVITDTISNVVALVATCGGVVLSDGGAPVTARGVCWRTSPNPTVNDNYTVDSSGTGSFTSNLIALMPDSTYHVRAYATNCIGTAYGNEIVFTVRQFCPDAPTVSDYDGNIYNTVQIGSQCWMKENLRTTHYANGTNISSNNYSNHSSSNIVLTQRGYHYNWSAVMNGDSSSNANPSGVQGICPIGWHVPSDTEWSLLTDYVSSLNQCVCGNNNNNIAKALATSTIWSFASNNCNVGRDMSSNNTTGFSAIPTGYLSDSFYDEYKTATFWSSTENNVNSDFAWFRSIFHNSSVVFRNNANKSRMRSVRCMKNVSSINMPPMVITNALSNITNTTAICGGNVSSDGGSAVIARGVCWNTTQNPTVSGDHTVDSSGTGNFTSTITGLTSGTTYYVRAYATNSAGTGYGEQRSFTTSAYLPTVTTDTLSNITDTTAICGGNVSSDGGSAVIARGVCWNTTQNPTVSGDHTVDSSGTGNFTSTITGLTSGTTYYVRAYATNSVGTAYGSQVEFSTALETGSDGQPCSNANTVTDYDGNVYNTVQLGNQCWMRENLKTTHYSDGTLISLGSSTSSSTAYLYYPNNVANNVSTFGYLYNWNAVMRNSTSSNTNPSGVQGICPVGWHVPSIVEWTQLVDYVGDQNQYVCGDAPSKIAKALASTTSWDYYDSPCSVGYDPTTNNATGFSVVPAGSFGSYESYFGSQGSLWSSTGTYYLLLDSGWSTVYFYDGSSYIGHSVRCIRD